LLRRLIIAGDPFAFADPQIEQALQPLVGRLAVLVGESARRSWRRRP
jgi:hypothetical protein